MKQLSGILMRQMSHVAGTPGTLHWGQAGMGWYWFMERLCLLVLSQIRI